MSYLGALTYEDFKARYLNQHNPATNAYWRLDEIAAKENIPLNVIEQWTSAAQTGRAVELGYAPLTPVPLPVVYPPPEPPPVRAVPPSVFPAEPPPPPGPVPRYTGETAAEKWQRMGATVNLLWIAAGALAIWAASRRRRPA